VRLSRDQLAELDGVLDAGPAATGWEDQRRTLARIRDHIGARFGVQYTIPGTWYLLRRRGWTCQLGARRGRAGRRRDRGMEEGDLAAGKWTAAALAAWIVFEDETGQALRPPRFRTWGRRGITPVIRVRGGSGPVSAAGLACCRPGHRTRLIYRMRHYRGRKGQTKAFT